MNRTQRIAAMAISALAVGVLAAGCGGSGDDSSDGKVTLRVNLFGKFGYKDLYKQFMKDHPSVKIVETAEGDLGKYNTQLSQQIAAGAAAGDVVAIEEGQIVNFLQSADKFVNLQDHGSNELKADWLPWTYAERHDGRRQDDDRPRDRRRRPGHVLPPRPVREGRPADRPRGGRASSGRRGRTSSPPAQKFQQGIKDPKSHFVDTATNTYNSILMQGGDHTYFDRDNKLVIDSNPAVKTAWDQSLKMIDAGLSAKLKAFSPEWNAGFKNGAFATARVPGLDDRLHQGPGR